MRVRFTLRGKENAVYVESNDLKELVYEAENELIRMVSEKDLKIKNEQFLVSKICEVVCQDAFSEDLELGELVG